MLRPVWVLVVLGRLLDRGADECPGAIRANPQGVFLAAGANPRIPDTLVQAY